MTHNWYAIRSKPNKEDFLAKQFNAYGMKVFYPQLRVTPVNPRSRKVRPYFPGYLFIHADLETINTSALMWMPGVANVVNFGGEPASVPEALINALEKHVKEINASNRPGAKDLKPGDIVIIQQGPFAGYEAIFDTRISGQDRVRVLLNLLQKRQVSLELRGQQIKRLKGS